MDFGDFSAMTARMHSACAHNRTDCFDPEKTANPLRQAESAEPSRRKIFASSANFISPTQPPALFVAPDLRLQHADGDGLKNGLDRFEFATFRLIQPHQRR